MSVAPAEGFPLAPEAPPPAASNPFVTAEPWVWEVDRPPIVVDEPEREPRPEVSDFERRVFREYAAHADDDGYCWPSQETIADVLGCWRETVNRRTRSLREAGWMRLVERRQSKRTKWRHNVYDVLPGLMLCPVSDCARQRVTRRAHARAHARRVVEIVRRRTRRGLGGGGDSGPDHTKWTGGLGPCRCPSCRPDKGQFTGPRPVDLARRRWRPAGPGWQDQLARRLRRAGFDPEPAYELEHRLDDLPLKVRSLA